MFRVLLRGLECGLGTQFCRSFAVLRRCLRAFVQFAHPYEQSVRENLAVASVVSGPKFALAACLDVLGQSVPLFREL